MPGKRRLQNARDGFDPVLQFAGMVVERALRNIAGQRHDETRPVDAVQQPCGRRRGVVDGIGVDLDGDVHTQRLGVLGKLAVGQRHPFQVLRRRHGAAVEPPVVVPRVRVAHEPTTGPVEQPDPGVGAGVDEAMRAGQAGLPDAPVVIGEAGPVPGARDLDARSVRFLDRRPQIVTGVLRVQVLAGQLHPVPSLLARYPEDMVA